MTIYCRSIAHVILQLDMYLRFIMSPRRTLTPIPLATFGTTVPTTDNEDKPDVDSDNRRRCLRQLSFRGQLRSSWWRQIDINQRSTTFGVQIGLRLLHWDSYHRMITNEISNRNWSTWGWYQKDMYRRRQQHHLLPRKHRISQGSHNTQWDSCRIHHPHHHHLCQLDRRWHHKDSHHKMDDLLTSG